MSVKPHEQVCRLIFLSLMKKNSKFGRTEEI